jgi:Spx/MgsR family transcriptional regulator
LKATLYGIPNCDTVKKARAWLAEHGVEYDFHDYKKRGIDAARLDAWFAQIGWQALLNRSGTTWRKLDEAHKASITSAAAASALMRAQPSVIRRPVIETKGVLLVGFDPLRYAEHFK